MLAQMAESEGEVRVPVVWVGAEELPVQASNNIAAQFSAENEFILTFGHVTPPLLLGEEDEKRAQLERISYVAVRPVARIGLGRQRVQELIRLLQENLAAHDEAYHGEET